MCGPLSYVSSRYLSIYPSIQITTAISKGPYDSSASF